MVDYQLLITKLIQALSETDGRSNFRVALLILIRGEALQRRRVCPNASSGHRLNWIKANHVLRAQGSIAGFWDKQMLDLPIPCPLAKLHSSSPSFPSQVRPGRLMRIPELLSVIIVNDGYDEN